MRIVLNYLKLKEDSNRLEVLHWGHFAFVFLGITFELFYGLGLLSWLLHVGLLFIFYRLFFITKKELFYSFWTFSAILFLFLINKILFSSLPTMEIRLLYFLGLCLLGIEVYILSSPIYYPRVSWWEYDFRYRTDLKVLITNEDIETDARITDLRRNAACVASFEEFKVGQEIEIKSDSYFSGKLKLEIVSKRIYSLGRPYNYGVKFVLNTEGESEAYSDLLNLWRNETLRRRERKFTKQNNA